VKCRVSINQRKTHEDEQHNGNSNKPRCNLNEVGILGFRKGEQSDGVCFLVALIVGNWGMPLLGRGIGETGIRSEQTWMCGDSQSNIRQLISLVLDHISDI
jgi:hypothetical protein